MRRLLAASAAVLLLCPALLAQGTFPLKMQEADEANAQVFAMASQGWGCQPAKPDEITKPPAGAAVTYCRMMLGGGEGMWAATVGGETPLLCIDANRNGDLTDDKTVEGKINGPQISFGTVEIPVSNTVSVRCRVEGFVGPNKAAQVLMVRSAGGPMGEVKLGDKTHRVALIDSNFNGRYNDRHTGGGLQTMREGDGFAIDLDGDGQFAPPSLEAETWEWMPLAKGFRTGDAFWTLTVAPDGSSVTVAKAAPKMGVLDLGGADATILAMSDFGIVTLKSGKEALELPEGDYTPFIITLRKADADGAVWMIQGNVDPDSGPKAVTVEAGKTTRMELGSPLSLKTDIQVDGRDCSAGLALVGKGGEAYAPRVMKGKTVSPAPKCEVVDEKGTVLAAGNFEYG